MAKQTIVFKHSDYAPSEWGKLLEAFAPQETDGWVSSIKIQCDISDTEVERPESILTWEEAEEIAKKRYGQFAELSYDDQQHGYWIHTGPSGKFFTEDDMLREKRFAQHQEKSGRNRRAGLIKDVHLQDTIDKMLWKKLPHKWFDEGSRDLIEEIYFRVEGLDNPKAHIMACIDYILDTGKGDPIGIDNLIHEEDDCKIWDYCK